MSRLAQRGSAMLVTMVLIAALLSGAAVLVTLQLASTRGLDLARASVSAKYCAEAGLSAARPVILANYSNWATALAGYPSTTEPTWLSTGIGSHDLDGDGVADFAVYIKDNEDELNGTNDYTVDNDLRVFVVSTCLKYSDTPKQVEELLHYSGGGTCYQSQGGGCGGNGNSN